MCHRLPTVDFETHGLPAVFCMNLQVPKCENPSMWSQALTGETMNVAIIFKIKRSTAEAAANLATAPPAVRLWDQYVREAPTFTGPEAGFRGRCGPSSPPCCALVETRTALCSVVSRDSLVPKVTSYGHLRLEVLCATG